MKVLIADDDLIMRHLLSSLLSDWGYEVTCAEDGNAAWDMLQKDHTIALAILDWMMPGANGVDIVRRLRAETSRPYTYVLLLTAKSGKTEVLEAMHAGCDDYLSKPFDAEELEARLSVGKRIIDLQQQLTNALRISQYQAAHDSLTGLLNRLAVLEVVEREANRSKRSHAPVSLALLDIDHFKNVNDSYGHFAGDEVLKAIARRIESHVRNYDSVARFGGEEFLIVTPDASVSDAIMVAERICKGISATPILVNNLNLTVTASIGVALLDTSRAISESLHATDEAMYRAKAKGRNRVEFEPPRVDIPGELPADAKEQ